MLESKINKGAVFLNFKERVMAKSDIIVSLNFNLTHSRIRL